MTMLQATMKKVVAAQKVARPVAGAVVGALGAMAAIAMAGCSRVQTTEVKPPRPVKAQAVAMAPPEMGIRYSATIEPFQQVPLAFKSSGYVDDVTRRPGADGRLRVAQAGDQVTKGMVLAKVRDADYRERINQGRAKLSEGEASLEKARLDLERAKTLFASESLTKPDLDSAQAAFDSARARVVAANAEIELATIALHDTALVVPSSGVLLERKIEAGALVGAGSVGFVLGDVSAVKARFGVPDSMIHAVALGAPIGVTVDAVAGDTFAGRVTSLAPAADPQSRVFDVEVTIPNADGRLRPGMIGTVAIDRTTRASSAPSARAGASATTNGHVQAAAADPAKPQPLIVPLTAIVRATGTSDDEAPQYALVVVERKGDMEVARKRPVQLGEVMGNGVAVLKGVALGERVVVTGATLLADGDPVRVIP